jgi:hypothetical protein
MDGGSPIAGRCTVSTIDPLAVMFQNTLLACNLTNSKWTANEMVVSAEVGSQYQVDTGQFRASI